MSSFYHLVQKTETGKYKCLMGSRSVQACFDRRRELLDDDKDLTLPNLIVWTDDHYRTAVKKHSFMEIPTSHPHGGFGEGIYGN